MFGVEEREKKAIDRSSAADIAWVPSINSDSRARPPIRASQLKTCLFMDKQAKGERSCSLASSKGQRRGEHGETQRTRSSEIRSSCLQFTAP